MKISLDWTKEYVDVDLPLGELVDRLTLVGLVVESVEDREGDSILDLDTYANRPDTLGHMGVAREIAAMLGRPLVRKDWPLTELPEETSASADIQVRDEKLCPRYCGVVVRGVSVGPSPDWLRRRIEAMGLHSINNIVDVTNYVLFATGQPIHAFDLDKISGTRIVIRKANKGETLKDFEGRVHELGSDMLVIADEVRPIAIAGVIGGEESGVTAGTRDVFIESAHFDPVSVRLTAKKLGLSTDASYRFERTTDVSFPPEGARMAASLMTRMGGKATRGILDVYPKPRKPKSLVLRERRVGEILGVDVPGNEVLRILGRLGFKITEQPPGAWRVEVPTFRVDIDREADLIEEVARFYGYDKIPSLITPIDSFEPERNRAKDCVGDLRETLLRQGFDEVINWSFADPEKENLAGSGRDPVPIRNPISNRASVLRTNLTMGLLENAARNLNRGLEGAHIFEVGSIYFREGDNYRERETLGVLSTGFLPGAGWQEKPRPADFFFLKGALEAVMTRLRYDPFSFKTAKRSPFEAGRSLTLLYKGQPVGVFGVLGSDLVAGYGLGGTVFAAEIDLEGLFEKQPRPFEIAPVPRYPGISRDLSFLADRGIPFQDIRKVLDKPPLAFVESYELVDRFTGPSIPSDKVSLSIRFRYRNPGRTLLAGEVDRVEQDIVERLKSAFHIHMREGSIDNRT
jgi:phenylalanyl-tRNA synthetase beta chain